VSLKKGKREQPSLFVFFQMYYFLGNKKAVKNTALAC
jgi:hypothetical protein